MFLSGYFVVAFLIKLTVTIDYQFPNFVLTLCFGKITPFSP